MTHEATLELAFRRALRPPPEGRIYEWAGTNIWLSPKVSPVSPGWYDVDQTPAMKGIYDAAQDGECRFISIQKSSQAGVTLAGYIIIGHRICNDPLPAAITMPSVTAAQKKAEKVFKPIIEDSPALRAEMPRNLDKFKNLEQDMLSMTINWMGTNNAGQLASDTYGILLIDEPDKYPIVMAGESTPLFLLMERTTVLWNHLIIMPCTPTTEKGVIHNEFKKGDRREYFVPCGHCGHYQVIRWKNFKFDSKLSPEEAGAGAYIECVSCKGRITGPMKNEMLHRGEWRGTAEPETYDRASFHYPRWLSTWESGSPYAIVRQFMQVKSKPNDLKGWIQNTLAEPFIEERIDLSDEELKARRHAYEWGQVPSATAWGCDFFEIQADEGGQILEEIRTVVTVDVQKTHLWVCARQWRLGGDSAGVEFMLMFTWDEVRAYAEKMDAWIVVIDAAYGQRTQEVYKVCAQYGFTPCMGRKRSTTGQAWNQTQVNIGEGTRQQKAGQSISLIMYESDAFRRLLVDRMNGFTLDEEKNRHRCIFKWAIAADAPSLPGEYVDQVTAEYYEPDREEWVIKEGRIGNHAWDCETMQMLAYEMMEPGWMMSLGQIATLQ